MRYLLLTECNINGNRTVCCCYIKQCLVSISVYLNYWYKLNNKLKLKAGKSSMLKLTATLSPSNWTNFGSTAEWLLALCRVNEALHVEDDFSDSNDFSSSHSVPVHCSTRFSISYEQIIINQSTASLINQHCIQCVTGESQNLVVQWPIVTINSFWYTGFGIIVKNYVHIQHHNTHFQF